MTVSIHKIIRKSLSVFVAAAVFVSVFAVNAVTVKAADPTYPAGVTTDLQKAAYAYYYSSGGGSGAGSRSASASDINTAAKLSGYTLIDLRSASDYATSHIKGAYNIPFGTDLAQKFKYVPRNKPIIAYSSDGQLSWQVAALLNITLGNLDGTVAPAVTGVKSLQSGFSSAKATLDAAGLTESAATALPATVYSSGSIPVLTDAQQAILDGYFANWDSLKNTDFADFIVTEAKAWNVSYTQDSDYISVALPASSGTIAGQIRIAYGGPDAAAAFAALPRDKKILVTCGSGQTAGNTVGFLRLLGYDAYSVYGGWGGGGQAGRGLNNYNLAQVAAGKPNLNIGNTSAQVQNAIVKTAATGYFATTEFTADKNVISAANALAKVGDAGYLFVDIRPQADYNTSHIDGAINLPYGTAVSDNLSKLAAQSAGKTVVVYSADGQLSSQVVPLLAIAGIKAKSLQSGWTAFTAQTGYAAKTSTTAATLGDTTSTSLNAEFVNATARYFGALSSRQGTNFANFNISAADLKTILDANHLSDYQLIDVRQAADYATGKIGDAINVPYASDNFVQNLTTALAGVNQYKKIIVNCYSGQTSSQTVAILRSLGYDAYSLTGGYTAWKALIDSQNVTTAPKDTNAQGTNDQSTAAPAASDSAATNPKTGDRGNYAGYTLIVVAAGLLALTAIRLSKKRRDSAR